MKFSWSLHTRFLLATSVLVLVLCGVFAVAVHHFIELLEDEMLNNTLVREMAQFKRDIAEGSTVLPSGGGLRPIVTRTARDRANIPTVLATLPRGIHEDISLGGKLYFVAVDDVGPAHLYLLLDTERVERLEDNVVGAALLLGVVAIGLAGIVGWLLARAVMRPVTDLASDVANLDPARRNERLENRFANREVGVIAAAFDDYMDRLERVLEREQSFTEDASHELRTPLAIVASAAELLAEEAGLSAAGHERVLRIRRASGQMQSLIEALLFLARGDEAGRAQNCALDQIVREAVELIAGSALVKSLQVNVAAEPVMVCASPVMVACVVNNLLLNAVNFTQNGRIDIHLTPAELIVRDTGIGIPPEDLSRVFERRFRGPHSRGLGLGLYLVSRICERLDWTIQAESAEGGGTTFRIQLDSTSVPEAKASVAAGTPAATHA
ncbi:MAG TPA: HAMP domain-containing sensor histidine kinase [Steroidobacteraceae bacterium]